MLGCRLLDHRQQTIGHKLEKPGCLLSPAALRRGILLGRYSRCDVAHLLGEHSISRAHALLLEVEGDVWLFDTASTEGTYARRLGERAREIRAVRLDSIDRAVLGEGRASLSWEPMAS